MQLSGRRQGTTWTVHHRATHRDKQSFMLTFTPIFDLVSSINLTLRAIGSWEETGAPSGNPCVYGKSTQTSHRKVPQSDPGPSCCETAVLSTAPPCCQPNAYKTKINIKDYS